MFVTHVQFFSLALFSLLSILALHYSRFLLLLALQRKSRGVKEALGIMASNVKKCKKIRNRGKFVFVVVDMLWKKKKMK